MTIRKFGHLKFVRFTQEEMSSNLLGEEAYIFDQIQKMGLSMANVVRIFGVVYPDGQEKKDCTIVILDTPKRDTHQRL